MKVEANRLNVCQIFVDNADGLSQYAGDSPEETPSSYRLPFALWDTPFLSRTWPVLLLEKEEGGFAVHEPFEAYVQGFARIDRIPSVPEPP